MATSTTTSDWTISQAADTDVPLLIRMLNEFAYRRRVLHLMHVERR